MLTVTMRKIANTIRRHGVVGAVAAAARRARAIVKGPNTWDDRFRGAFSSYRDAIAAVSPDLLPGYDNDQAVYFDLERMSQIVPTDRPVLFWMRRLTPEIKCVLDAGGHIGVKYRAFRQHLQLDAKQIKWIVYDTKAMVRAGRRRAAADQLDALSFVETLAEVPHVDLMLCSGLLQYLDISLSELIGQLPTRPRHLILNKVATRDGKTIVMLERIGDAEVPYQVRDRAEFVSSLNALGYEIWDEWVLPEFAHQIRADPALGKSTSRGYYARLLANGQH
jgi:putative methyltransferase (TIGR04325 family)